MVSTQLFGADFLLKDLLLPNIVGACHGVIAFTPLKNFVDLFLQIKHPWHI